MPQPYGKFFWSPALEQATPFSSWEEANGWKNQVGNATGIVEFNSKWFVVKDADWRVEAFLILDRKFSESPHLHTAIKSGDYEVHCSKCGKVETFPQAGDGKGDAFTFALRVAGQHAHKE